MTPRTVAMVLIACFAIGTAESRAQSILTVAGGGTDDGRPATLAGLLSPSAVVVDSAGNLFLVESSAHRVRRVAAGSGIITTAAGNGSAGFSGDGGLATSAELQYPRAVVVDSSGNLYIADGTNRRIRRVTAEGGIITTVAGNGEFVRGDGGAATQAAFSHPAALAFDSSGNLYIADSGDHRVRRVAAETGIITTIAGIGAPGGRGDGGAAIAAELHDPAGLAIDTAGHLYIADFNNHRIRRVDAITGIITTVAGDGSEGSEGDGGPATAARLYRPSAVAADSAGNIYIPEYASHRVRKVSAATGTINTIAGGAFGEPLGDGLPATSAALRSPDGVAVDASGNLYIGDSGNNRVRRVDAENSIISTVAGNGTLGFTGDAGPATAAGIEFPRDVAIDANGNLYISDYNNRIRRVDRISGIIRTIAGSGTRGSAGDGGPATEAQLNDPGGLALDANGNLYIADIFNQRVRRVTAASGIITTVAGNGSTGFAGDGGAATEAALNIPMDVAVDAAGNLYIADLQNNRIRKVAAASGTITTVAGGESRGFGGDGGAATAALLSYPSGVVVDTAGNLFIADSDNDRIRRLAAASGIITTVAGNGTRGFRGDGSPATSASVSFPQGISLDAAGNLYIADSGSNNRIRKVIFATGIMTTVAGNGSQGFTGDGGSATAAGLNSPSGVAADPAGSLFIADLNGDRVRAVFSCVDLVSPALMSPAVSSGGISTSPRLAWSSVKGAFRYDVYLDTVSPPRTIVAPDITTTTYAPANLEPLTTYHWKVVAKGDPFCEPFRTAESPVWSFTTTGACQAPGAIVP